MLIEFSSDPDVLITEKLQSGVRYILSIEVKGGTDASNIHNRLGEAEKSHLKAKKFGIPSVIASRSFQPRIYVRTASNRVAPPLPRLPGS